MRLQRLRDWIARNWGMKLVSLLLAFLVWLFVVGQEQREEHFKIRLTLENTPDTLTITSRVPEFITVRLVGPRTLLSAVRTRLLATSLDLAGMQEGVSAYQVLPSRLGLPPGIEVAEISPATITLQADRKIRKTLKVKPRLVGSPAGGFEIAELRVTPAEIEVEGAEKPLKAAREVATELVDVTGLDGPLSRPVALAPSDPTFRAAGGATLRLDVRVTEQRGERGFVRVPVQAPPGFAARPSFVEVRLSGSLAALGRLSSADIVVRAQQGVGGGGPSPVAVALPVGTTLVSVSPEEVRLTPSSTTSSAR